MHAYHILKQSILGKHIIVADDVVLTAPTMLQALLQLDAVQPVLLEWSKGQATFKDKGGWNYLVNLN